MALISCFIIELMLAALTPLESLFWVVLVPLVIPASLYEAPIPLKEPRPSVYEGETEAPILYLRIFLLGPTVINLGYFFANTGAPFCTDVFMLI